ncbi:CotS family spore coat protein [Tepidibacter formicigenes]|jgi:CotS family spore coat protein|uniref:Spore coat protein I n=1 Tax=Tepidibacter formicigenes DSM 15518 TaxID=1123349 RepID=A0A1M6N0X0_9FIRM|nr:CotS family spore coat protein [Tepidibacter formicigenes]SHJ89379.1 spore coat protein I [Tepidibacter formicigenes DSM 15518]
MENLINLAKSVLSNYNINPDNIKIIQNSGLKTLWKFNCKDKTMCLKRLRHSKEKALFSVNAQINVYNNGGHVPKVYLNSNNNPITEYNEQLFVLYEWIDGRDLYFNNPTDFRLALEGLAKFHIASRGYVPPKGAKISSKLGRWNEQYESMKKRMLKWKEEAKNNLSNISHKSYYENIDSIINIADMALNGLEKSAYKDLTNIELSKSTLCHQDFGEGNVIFSGTESYVIDLDGATYDLVIRDLRKIIGKRMQKRGKWQEEIINTILNWYEKNNKLSLEEKEILKIDLLYPHWFFGEVKNLYKKNKYLSPNKIERIAELEKSKVRILKNLF